MPWAIGSSLRWLGRALLSPSGEGPSQFDDGPVSPILDVFQQGAGVAVAEWSQGDSTAVGDTFFTIYERDVNRTRIVWGSLLRANGGAPAAIDVRIVMNPPVTAGNEQLTMWRDGTWGTAATETTRTWQQLGMGQRYWLLPPGCRLVGRHLGIAAGDTLRWRFLAYSVPAGFKLW